MSATIGVRALELLVSRLCHDLVGPVGAINNGVELIEEAGLADSEEALDLVAESAEIAARRLKVFRLAFGAAGGQDGLSPGDLRAVLEGWFRGGRVAFTWVATDLPTAPRGFFKLLLVGALLAEEAMPQGGTLTLTAHPTGLALDGTGPGAGLREEVRAALCEDVDDDTLTPRSVLAHAARRIAAAYGLDLTAGAPKPGAVCLHLTIPA